MTKTKKILHLENKEINSLFEVIPTSLITTSNFIGVIVILGLLILSMVINYPLKADGNVLLTTKNPPEIVSSPVNGKIDNLLVANDQYVLPRDPLLVLRNNANYNDILFIKNKMPQVNSIANHQDALQGIEVYSNFFQESTKLTLGRLHSDFFEFKMSFEKFKIVALQKSYTNSKRSFQIENNQMQLRIVNIEKQTSLLEKELNESQNNRNRYKTFFEDGLVSKLEYDKSISQTHDTENKYRDRLLYLSREREHLLNNQIEESTLQIENSNLISETWTNFQNHQYKLSEAIYNWERTHIIFAQIEGRIHFRNHIALNKDVVAGSELFVIEPLKSNNQIVSEITIPSKSFGKLKEGQEVQIFLEGYPENEFGFLRAYVSSISQIPDYNGNYSILAEFDNGLHSSTNVTIPYRPNLSGKASVLLDNKSLMFRLLKSFN